MVDDRDPLISAIQHGDLKKVIDLMDAEMDIDALLRGTGKAAIHWAALADQVNIVQYLVDNQADINVNSTSDGRSPIHNAADSSAVGVVKVLLIRGVDINDQDALGDTALHIAVNAEDVDMVGLLLERGARVNLLNFSSDTPLSYASRLITDSPEKNPIVELLKRHGALYRKPERWEVWKKR